jgi:quercetin dioxygenase-like cupin family protein
MDIRLGDVVWCLPNAKHWHIAMQEALDGKVVAWMEQVSDAQYQA